MMKQFRILLPLTISMLVTPIFAAAPKADSSQAIQSEGDKLSYSIGVDIGRNFKDQDIRVNEKYFVQGLQDGIKGGQYQLSEEEIRNTLVNLQKQIVEKQNEEMKKLAQENLNKGKKYLAENKKKKDVISLPSGLQYRILKEGKGTPPLASDSVTTHYKGKLIDGTEFDSSYARGEPAQFPVEGVIPGWTEALQLMKPGSKWEVFVPAALAYGEQGVGRVIGPNETLIFEIELISVDKEKEKDKE